MAKAKAPVITHPATVAEYAEFWKIDQATVRRLINEGSLLALRLGRSIRVDLYAGWTPVVEAK